MWTNMQNWFDMKNEKNRLIKAIKHPEWLFGAILRRTIGPYMGDESFIKWE